MNTKKVVIFDLDGTLAESKQPLDTEMAGLLKNLIESGYIIAVMSGGSLNQYKQQFLPFLTLTEKEYSSLYILPTSGASMYRYHDAQWVEVYSQTLSLKNSAKIIKTLQEAAQATGNIPEKIYGEQIEDRGSQITYSALGQHAPIEEKSVWDPTHAKRKEIVFYFSKKLPEFMVHIGGMTSIDVTEIGIDKTYGIEQLSKILSIPIRDMLFIGDALYPGGNDEPTRASGIECIAVSNIDNTKQCINALIIGARAK